MAGKTSEAQKRASRAWEQKNRKKATVQGYLRTARSYIRNHAQEENLQELEALIKERREKLEEEGE